MAVLGSDIQVLITSVLQRLPEVIQAEDPLDGQRHIYEYRFTQSGILYVLAIEAKDEHYLIRLRVLSWADGRVIAEIVLDCDEIIVNDPDYPEDSGPHLIFQARRLGEPESHRHWLRISRMAEGFDVGSYHMAEYPGGSVR